MDFSARMRYHSGVLALIPLVVCLQAPRIEKVLTTQVPFPKDIEVVAMSPSGHHAAALGGTRLEEVDLVAGTWRGWKVAGDTNTICYAGDDLYAFRIDGGVMKLDRPSHDFKGTKAIRELVRFPAYTGDMSKVYYATVPEDDKDPRGWMIVGLDLKSGKDLFRLTRRAIQGQFEVSPDGSSVLSFANLPTGDKERFRFKFEIYRPATKTTTTLQDFTLRWVNEHSMEGAYFTSSHFSPSGSLVLATWVTIHKDGGGDGFLATFDAKTGQLKTKRTFPESNFGQTAFLGSDDRILYEDLDRLVVYDLAAGKELASTKIEPQDHDQIAVSKSGEFVATSAGKVMTVYKIATKP